MRVFYITQTLTGWYETSGPLVETTSSMKWNQIWAEQNNIVYSLSFPGVMERSLLQGASH